MIFLKVFENDLKKFNLNRILVMCTHICVIM